MVFHQIYCRKCSLFFITKTTKEPCPICGWIMMADYHKDSLFNKGNKMESMIQKQMKVYIAASATQCQKAKFLAEKMREVGFDIVSFWHDTDKEVGYDSAPRAIRDVFGVEQCELLVELIGDDESRGGRHCELGMAIAWNKKIILIGEIDGCIFQNLPWLPRMKNVKEFLAKIC